MRRMRRHGGPAPKLDEAAVTAGRPVPKAAAKVSEVSDAAQRHEEGDDRREGRRKNRSRGKKKAGLSGIVIAAIVGGGALLLVAVIAVIGTVLFLFGGKPEVVPAKPMVEGPVPAAVPNQPPAIPQPPPQPIAVAAKTDPAPPVPLPIATGNPQDVPPGWKQYAPSGATSFSARIPLKGKSYEATKTISIKKFGAMRIKIAHVDPEGGPSYTVGLLALPAVAASKVQPGDWMDLFRDAHIKETKGTLTKETDILQGKVAGKDYVVQNNQGVSRMRLYLAKANVYRAEVAGTQAQVESPEAQMFLDSLKLPWHETGIPITTPGKK